MFADIYETRTMKMDGSWSRRAAVLAATGLLAGLAACGGGEEQAEGAEPAEAVVVLSQQDVALARASGLASGVVLSGSLDPWRVAEVRAQVSGTVAAIAAEAGERVAEGEVLARISAEGIRSQAAGAQAGVAAAEANLALARRQLESARTLHEAGAMSDLEFQQAQAQFEAAQSQLAAARAQASTAGEAAGNTIVRAPFAGEVSERVVELGEVVNPGQTLFHVVNTDYLELEGQVAVEDAARLRPGQPVEFSLAAYPGTVFTGEVARIEPTADPATRQVGVYVRLPNRERGLVGGLFATGRILTGEAGESQVAVPIAAVREAAGSTYVWVLRDGTARRQEVRTGATDPERGLVAILDGVDAGERVVVAPGELTEGARVRLAGESTTAPAGEEG